MPSVTHQWLLLWIARKMAVDGLVVAGYEGPTPQGGCWNELSRPFEICGVRADTWAFHPTSGDLSVGEAKTESDLTNHHTIRQIQVLGHLAQRIPRKLCRLYIAVPRSASQSLDRLLAKSGLATAKQIVRLHIPDCLVAEDIRGHA